jgi:ABC-type transport system substrate-binding protein
MNNYWSSVLHKRQLTRRRLLAGATVGGSSLLALSLIGCGGGDEGGVAGDASGLLGRVEDTTKSAKPGGAWASSFAEDIVNMDPIVNNSSPTQTHLGYVYSSLLKSGLSATKTPGADLIGGDAAESWEMSPDATQITLKLRANHKFDPRPPTNGRAMDSSDVKWSWEKYEAVGYSASELATARNPAAPIQTISTPDPRTVVFKLAYPYAGVTDLLSSSSITLYVMPKDETFNFKSDMRGSGPFFLESYRPSAGLTFVKNKDWYDNPRPYFDRIDRPLISEYASGLAQFKSQNIWNYEVRGEDILQTKRDHMDMLMLPAKEVTTSLGGYLNFSKRDNSKFKDVRLRRAMSMMLDRDLLISVAEGTDRFTAAGLPMRIYWSGHIAPGLPEWLDPNSDALGEGAKFFKFDPAEARKLVQATGVAMPYAAPFGHYIDQVPADQPRFQTLIGMFNEGGIFNITSDPLLYNTSWRTARQAAGMEHEGVLWHRTGSFSADIMLTMMYTPDGRNSQNAKPHPGVTDLVLKQKTELDPQKRTAIIHDIQKQLSMDWPVLPWAGTAPGFTLRWPWLANHGVFIEGSSSARAYTHFWYDEKKKTA